MAISPKVAKMAAMRPRGYQLEMLEESLRRNIIVAMPTGSGKTFIGVLRIQAELERASDHKRIWFLCPKVALAAQQYLALRRSLPPAYDILLLHGQDGVDRWRSQLIWDRVLCDISIVVCTYQVLTDALESGYVKLAGISLLVFDEAHCCDKQHAANRIMQNFYHPAKRKGHPVPSVLGLTASPGKKGADGLVVEQNLDAISRTSRLNAEELAEHSNLPCIVTLTYSIVPSVLGAAFLHQLKLIRVKLYEEIEHDPRVVWLNSFDEDNWNFELERDLSEAVNGGKTWCQEQAKRLLNVAQDVAIELGYFSLHSYLKRCISKLLYTNDPTLHVPDALRAAEIEYLSKVLSTVVWDESDPKIEDVENHSAKVTMLIDTIVAEMKERTTAIVFVKTRAKVRLLSDILEAHSRTRDILKIGTFVGSSSYQNRPSHISELIDATGQDDTLDDLRNGIINLIVATNVLEEGIDISACNLVICYDRPDHVRSYIQRKGRARKADSRYVLLFSAGEDKRLREWQSQEAELKAKYEDNKRELKELERLDEEEEGYREHVVESTGAKLLLTNAVDRLHKFCAKLPSSFGSSFRPVFDFERHPVNNNFRCVVRLSNDLDESLRRHESHDYWPSEALARKDAAFEAVLALHRAELIDDHLVASAVFDKEAEEVLKGFEKQPNMVEVEKSLDIWPIVAQEWPKIVSPYRCSVHMRIRRQGLDTEERCILLLSSLPFPQISGLTLAIDMETEIQLEFREENDPTLFLNVATAEAITRLIFRAGLRTRIGPDQTGFPILCVPHESMKEPNAWLETMSGTMPGLKAFKAAKKAGANETSQFGILRNSAKYETNWIPLSPQELSSRSNHPSVKPAFWARKLPKRRDFTHPIPETAKDRARELVDADTVTVDRLPIAWAYLSLALPSIYHHISVHWIAENLRTTALNGIIGREHLGFILTAISAPQAREASNYQRIEFLGDSLLKAYTTLALLVAQRLWPEGYLSRAKDQIVSNIRLASVTRKLGLSKFILRKVFTGAKWRPPYTQNFPVTETEDTPQTQLVSTKTLADIVEALLGASWLAGGESTLLKCLAIFFPKIDWDPSATSLAALKVRARPVEPSEPYNTQLYTLVGHQFKTPSLMLEAVTSTGRCEVTGLPSYQRLEFLGDAILDLVVTFRLWTDPTEMPERFMHRIRTAAVNAQFLGYCLLNQHIKVPIVTPSLQIPLGDTQVQDEGTEVLPGASLRSQTVEKTLLSFLRASRTFEQTSDFVHMRQRLDQYKPQLENQLRSGGVYPWADLAAFSPPKVTSDLIESTLAALVIDHGELAIGVGDEAVSPALQFLNKMGVLPWLHDCMTSNAADAPSYDPYQVWHPCEELGFLTQQEQVEYREFLPDVDAAPLPSPRKKRKRGHELQREPSGASLVSEESHLGEATAASRRWCRIFMGSNAVAEASGHSWSEARVRAAEAAVATLRQERAMKKRRMEELDADSGIGGLFAEAAAEIPPSPSNGTILDSQLNGSMDSLGGVPLAGIHLEPTPPQSQGDTKD